MTATENKPDRVGSIPRTRGVRILAVAMSVALTTGVIVSAGGGTANAAETIRAQAVGRFIDGTVGGMPIESLADLKDARAKAPPDTKQFNPLEAELLGQLDIPLGDALKLPGGGVFTLGAANQIAVAKSDRSSAGASGAISNTGGIELSDANPEHPSNAKINLSSAALGSVPVPGLPALPGLPAVPGLHADSFGGLSANIGAVAAIVGTDKSGKVVTPESQVANVKLSIGSPALGALLGQLKKAFNDNVLKTLIGNAPGTDLLGLDKCALTAPTPQPISLDGGAVVLDAANATISIDLGKLIKQLLGKDISDLDTSNFDLIDFLVKNLPDILSTGLSSVVTGITGSLQAQFGNCIKLLPTPLNALATLIKKALDDGQAQLVTAITGLATQFKSAGAGPLAMLADGLKNVVDIGLNVQSGPGIEPHDKTYPFESNLAATPDQATPVVKNQTLVRAIEIDLLDAAGADSLPIGDLPPIPGLDSLPGSNSVHERQIAGTAHDVVPRALAPGDGAAVLALGNAAAGPSSLPAAATPTPTAPPTKGVPTTAIPTGVPAGAAGHDGSPLLPIVLLLLGLMVAGGGVLTYRYRGRFSR